MAIPDRVNRLIFDFTALAVCLAPLMLNYDGPRDRVSPDSSDPRLNNESTGASAPTEIVPIVCRNPIQDFGRVMAGTPVHADFVIENVTDQPVWLEILEACSCAPWDTVRCIEPFGTITVSRTVWLPTSLSGPFQKTLNVYTIAEPANSLLVLEKLEKHLARSN